MILVLISDFMQDEIYLSEEVKYYGKFEKVIYFSIKGHQYSNKHLSPCQNMIIGETDIFYRNLLDRFYYLCKGIFNKFGQQELFNIIRSNKLSIFCLKQYSLFAAKSQLAYSHIKKSLDKLEIKENERIVFYSYRMGIGTMAAIYLKKHYFNSKVITRCHGQDLFSFRNSYDYLPFREMIYRNVDKIYCISHDGEAYIRGKYTNVAYKVVTHPLGTAEIPYNNNLSNNPFIILTCSRIVPIKRLHLLAESLKDMSENITWVHYGNGDNGYYEKINGICQQFPSNIQVIFKGFVDNDSLKKLYSKEHYSVFVNISESEGLPVSIMEACSAGLPVIATDVGGTKEIVSSNNGILLKKDFSLEDLKKALRTFVEMDIVQYNNMSAASRKKWEEQYFSRINYQKFSDDVYYLNCK